MPLGALTPRALAAYAAAIARAEVRGWLRAAQEEDRLRREQQARAHGVSVATYQAFRAATHPPGLKYPLADRKSRTRWRKRPAGRAWPRRVEAR